MLNPPAAPPLENRGYSGPGGLDDWGNKGAHWHAPGHRGKGDVEVGIEAGPGGDFVYGPVYPDKTSAKDFDAAKKWVDQRLKTGKGLQKLLDQINGALDSPLNDTRSEEWRKKMEDVERLVRKKIAEVKAREQATESDRESGDKNVPKKNVPKKGK